MSATGSELADGFIVLLHLIQAAGNEEYTPATSVFAVANLEAHYGWTEGVFSSIVDSGWAEYMGPNVVPSRYAQFHITESGRAHAEHLISKGDERVPNSVVAAWKARVARLDQRIEPVDSQTWTGLRRTGTLNERERQLLLRGLIEVSNRISASGASNLDVASARAYLLAIQALANAPDPPADLIWELVARANNLAGIASFFVSVFALFVVAAN